MPTAVDHGKIWEDCLLYISHRIKKQSFATWLKHTHAVSDGNGGLQINVPNQFVSEWIDEHYSELIEEAIHQACGERIPFVLQVSGDDLHQTELELSPKAAAARPAEPAASAPKRQPGMLNERYTFDKLVVGNFN